MEKVSSGCVFGGHWGFRLYNKAKLEVCQIRMRKHEVADLVSYENMVTDKFLLRTCNRLRQLKAV